MRIGEIEVTPLAAESMGVRSLCTEIETPDIKIVLDPSAALAYRPPYDPHPLEYRALDAALQRIRLNVEDADILTISHYHFDHVRPGVTNWHYNFSTKEDRLAVFGGKTILAKDGRSNINASQRRRAYYFQKDMHEISNILVADANRFTYGHTTITFSPPLPHGPDASKLGYVVAATVEYDGLKVIYAPDVQGPTSRKALSYLVRVNAQLAIVGGPPLYISGYTTKDRQDALFSLSALAADISVLVIDHHMLRDDSWSDWISPIRRVARESGNRILSMAELAGTNPQHLEARRKDLYEQQPPGTEFIDWLNATEDFKVRNRPPV